MSDFSSDFRAHLERDCTTLCHCWRVTRRDGRVFGFTDHDRRLTVAGQDYEPQSGFSQTEARASFGMAVDAVDVEGALSSDVLTEADTGSKASTRRRRAAVSPDMSSMRRRPRGRRWSLSPISAASASATTTARCCSTTGC